VAVDALSDDLVAPGFVESLSWRVVGLSGGVVVSLFEPC
jgi:hypothetical protein